MLACARVTAPHMVTVHGDRGTRRRRHAAHELCCALRSATSVRKILCVHACAVCAMTVARARGTSAFSPPPPERTRHQQSPAAVDYCVPETSTAASARRGAAAAAGELADATLFPALTGALTARRRSVTPHRCPGFPTGRQSCCPVVVAWRCFPSRAALPSSPLRRRDSPSAPVQRSSFFWIGQTTFSCRFQPSGCAFAVQARAWFTPTRIITPSASLSLSLFRPFVVLLPHSRVVAHRPSRRLLTPRQRLR